MKSNRHFWQVAVPALLWGATWGVAEMTLGTGLHYTGLPVVSSIMFPIGFYCLYRGYRASRSWSWVGIAVVLAALMKLSAVFIPQPIVPFYRIINPAMAICLEGMACIAWVRRMDKAAGEWKGWGLLGGCLLCSFSWRVCFLLFQLGMEGMTGSPTLLDAPKAVAADFFVTQMLAGALLLAVATMWVARAEKAVA